MINPLHALTGLLGRRVALLDPSLVLTGQVHVDHPDCACDALGEGLAWSCRCGDADEFDDDGRPAPRGAPSFDPPASGRGHNSNFQPARAPARRLYPG